MAKRDFLMVDTEGERYRAWLARCQTGDHLTEDALRNYLRGSDALREDAAIQGLTEEENLERLVAIAGRANQR